MKYDQSRTVEGAIAADPNDRLAIAEDNIDGFGPPPGGFFHGWSDECGNAVDLRGMKDGERPQERNASRMVFFAIGRIVVPYCQLFEEVYGGAFFTSANLPSSFRCLPVGAKARIIAGEGKGRHAEDKGVDASVAASVAALTGMDGPPALLGSHGFCHGRVPASRAAMMRSVSS